MLLLPVTTIAIIVLVCLLLVVVIVVAVLRSKCCSERNDKNKSKHEELDRFLNPEESEDEIRSTTIKAKISNKVLKDNTSYEEGTFHFVDVHVEENVHVDNTSEGLESDAVIGGLDDEVIPENLSNDNVDLLQEPVICAVENTPVSAENIPITLQDNPPNELTSIEFPPSETPILLSVPTGRDDGSVYSEDLSDHSNVSGTNKMVGLRKQSEKSRVSSQGNAAAFTENAKLKICLQYIESVKCLKGTIISIEGLNFQTEHCPQEINFHLRFFPNKRFHIATKFKPVWEDATLNLTFTMGPVYTEDLTNNALRIKLYGKKAQRLTRSRCYGECSYNLGQVIGKVGPIEFEENVIQRVSGSIVYSSDSDGVI